MIGFESYGGYGGCSSNLSPLATPYTVDRTVLSLNPNPSVNFLNEPPPPPPPPPYSGATYSWVPSNPTPMADYYTSFNSEADSMPRPILDNYLVHVSPLINTGVNESSGGFSYARCTDSVKTAVNSAQPYFPSYASPAIEEKEPLVQLGDSTHDFLSTCCITAPSDRTYQDDYSKKVSGWGSSIRWDDSWNGFKDLESGNCTDLNWSSSFYSSEKNDADPALLSRPPGIGTWSSQLNMDLPRQNEDYFRISDLVVNYPHLTLNSDRYENCSTNPSRFSLCLEKDGKNDANSSLSLSKKMVVGSLISNKALSQASELHLPQTSPNRSPSILDEGKVSDSADNSSKGLDIYNTAEDSPCWKGASSSQFSCFEGSDALAPPPLIERSSDTRDGFQSFSCNPNRSIENSFSPSVKRTSFTTYPYGEEEGRLKSPKLGTFVPEQKCNGIFASNSKPVGRDVGLTFEKCTFGDRSEETGKKNPEESSGICDKEDDTSNLAKPNAEESTPKIDFAALLKTIQNLSDMLVFCCSNEEYALKEHDNVALKHVINNLNSCMLRIPQHTLKRKSVFCQDLHRDKGDTEIHNQHAHEKQAHNILPCMKDEKFQDFFTVASDIAKPDEMTRAIKKALSENFNGEEDTLPQALLYKNLWLEAEAVICSTNFKARFDRMKSEMDKSKRPEAKDGFQDMVNMEFSHYKVSPDAKMVDNLSTDTNYSNQDSSPMICNTSPRGDDAMARFCMLKSRDLNSISMNSTDTMMIDSGSITKQKEFDTFASEISTTNLEAEVVARFHILKSRDDKLTSMNPMDMIKEDSSSDAFPGLKSIETKSSIPASPFISTTDLEDGVIARFRILQSRGDSSSSTSLNLADTTKPSSPKEFPSSKEFPSRKDLASNICKPNGSPISSKTRQANDADDSVLSRLRILTCLVDKKDKTFDTGIGHDLQNPVVQSNVDELYVKMASESCKEDEVENQNSTGWYDGPSLDWEHVLKDDFVRQN